jgi:hypothetical protein
MKTLNPIEDIMTKTAKLYFEICQLAELTYQLGPFSGAKRTILLFIHQRGPVFVDDLAREFSDPTQSDGGAQLIKDLAQSRLLSTNTLQGRLQLRLTEAGQSKVSEIKKREASMAAQMPAELNVAEIRKAVRTMEQFREAMDDIQRHITQQSERQGKVG